MTAQSIHFFTAGFEPTSFILSVTLLELAVHEDIQQKLQEQIDDAMMHYEDQTITYSMIKNLPFLHKVVQGNYVKCYSVQFFECMPQRSHLTQKIAIF